MRTRLMATALAAVAVPAALALAVTPASAADTASVSVFHGVPGLTVDVYVNGDLTLDNFKPGDLAGPLDLPADTYTVEITDKNDKGTVLIGPAEIPVEAGGSYTIAAYLDAKGSPTASAFANDVSAVAAGEARVTVRHVAAAPAVTIEADGTVLVPNLRNGKEAVADVPAATYDVSVLPAAGGDAVADTPLALPEGANTIVYAWGDLADGTFAFATQAIDGLHSSPTGVPAGEAGLAAQGMPAGLLAAMALAALAAAGAGVQLVRARQSA
jgi:hypothetical protein